jgi:mRNA interferase MazF
MGVVAARRFDVVLVSLDPTIGSEIQRTRPCLVISPDEMNEALRTAVVAPMTTGGRPFPWRVAVRFEGKEGLILLDQVRTVDEHRLVRQLGRINPATAGQVLDTLASMFAP